MVDVLAGIGVIALVIGAGIFVNYMENVDDKRKQDRNDDYVEDDDWWNDQEA